MRLKPLAKNFKNFKKSLDKLLKKCYNNYNKEKGVIPNAYKKIKKLKNKKKS